MENELNVRLQHAVEHDETIDGVTTQLPSYSSVPKDGEIIFNRDRTNFKVGNGNTTYSQLNNFLKTIGVASGADIGDVGTPSVTTSTVGNTIIFTFHQLKGEQGTQGEQGPTGPQGSQGNTGVGISSIAKTATSGLVDTYTVTYTDSTTTTYTVTNGADGQDLTEKPVYTYTGSGTASCNDIITNSFGAGNPISNYSGIIINYSQVSGTETTGQKIVQFNPDNRLNGLNIGQKFTIIIKGYSTTNALMQLGMKINFSSSYNATGTVTISMDGSTLYFEKIGSYNYYYDSTHIYYTCLVLSFTKIGTNSFILE